RNTTGDRAGTRGDGVRGWAGCPRGERHMIAVLVPAVILLVLLVHAALAVYNRRLDRQAVLDQARRWPRSALRWAASAARRVHPRLARDAGTAPARPALPQRRAPASRPALPARKDSTEPAAAGSAPAVGRAAVPPPRRAE